MGGMRIVVLAAIALSGVAWACSSTFACSDDEQCTGTETAGFCEASGYCSFEDETCPSNRRYGTLAGGGWAGQCVPSADTTGVAEGSTSSTNGSNSTSNGSVPTTNDPTTGEVETSSDTTGTGAPVDPSTTSGSTTDTTGSMPIGSSTSTTGGTGGLESTATTDPPDPPCTPTFVDEFDDGELDGQWGTWNDVGCSAVESSGRLEFTVTQSTMDWVSAGLYTPETDFLGGYTRAELVPFTAPLDFVGVWLTLFDASDCEIQIAAENHHIRGHSAGVWFDPVPVDTEQPLWLQLRVQDDGFVHWEYSSDGQSWVEAHAEMPPCDFAAARSALFSGGVHQHTSDISRAVESYERCEAP